MKQKVLNKKVLAAIVGAICLTGCMANGKDGTPGSIWYSGNDDPISSLGQKGDFYFEIDDCDVWEKTESGWKVVSNLKGDKGDTGSTGQTGPQGNPGSTGTPGSAGQPGNDGTAWFTGTVVQGTGSNIGVVVENSKIGDLYFNTSTNDVYKCVELNVWSWIANIKGESGSDGNPGNPGNDGVDGQPGQTGTLWFTGTQIFGTESGIGVAVEGARVGDIYLNTTTNDIYKCVALNVWDWISNIKGEQGNVGQPGEPGKDGETGAPGTNGSNGAFWHTGVLVTGEDEAIVVEVENSKAGDLYFNIETNDIYKCVGDNTWEWLTNIKGAPGTNGEQGQPGANGNDGVAGTPGINGTVWFTGVEISGVDVEIVVEIEGSKVGDLYLNTQTNDIYKCVGNNTWNWIANIKGDKGEDYGDSSNVSTGTIWFTGTEITGKEDGIIVEITDSKVGDLYFNTSTTDVYKCVSLNTWNWIANIRGEDTTEPDIEEKEYKFELASSGGGTDNRAVDYVELEAGTTVSFADEASWSKYKFAIALDNDWQGAQWIGGGYMPTNGSHTVASTGTYTIMIAKQVDGVFTPAELEELESIMKFEVGEVEENPDLEDPLPEIELGENEALFGETKLSVVDDIASMSFDKDYTIQGPSNLNFGTATGRAVSTTNVLSNSGRHIISLSDEAKSKGVNFLVYTFSDKVMNSDSFIGSTAYSQDSVTIEDNEKYVMIIFKNGTGNTSFSDDELLLLPTYLSVKEATEEEPGESEALVWKNDFSALSEKRAGTTATIKAGTKINFADSATWETYKYAIGPGSSGMSTSWIGGGYQTGECTISSDGTYTIMIARQDDQPISIEDMATFKDLFIIS